MILGIDASNIREGGGVTHLVELLGAADPLKFGFSKVIVWSKKTTLDQIKDFPWIEKIYLPVFEKNLLSRILWQKLQLSKIVRTFSCNVLFIPGGSYAGDFKPVVTMSQNLLPFEWVELSRFGLSLTLIKMMLLRFTQSRTFKKAEGLIFLTEYAQCVVSKIIQRVYAKIKIIPHGIDTRFFIEPRLQKPVKEYSKTNPCRILYVSIVHVYKHQWCVAEAIALLKKNGIPVELDLVGPAYPKSLQQLQNTLEKIDPAGDFVHYVGEIPHSELHERYAKADVCVFASSCENMPNILLEAMAAGLPIACSNRGPMPEVLGDAGVYFDPEKPTEIADAIECLINDEMKRNEIANKAFNRVQEYSWERCADETFGFLSEISQKEI